MDSSLSLHSSREKDWGLTSIICPQLLQKRSRTLGAVVSSDDSEARVFNLSPDVRRNFPFRFIEKEHTRRRAARLRY